MLDVISQTQKDMDFTTALTWGSRAGELIEAEKSNGDYQGLGK